ncbi:MAG: alpha/beta fold hydrolase [Deltaproteobacteria bacterium]|nr:alpha/beta fold hydrolase [Deltaproteobacteria bacterium]
MTTMQMAILTALLVIVLVVKRLGLHKGLRSGFPGMVASLATSWRRLWVGVIYKQTEVQGYDLAYLEGGKGETVVFLHGFASEKDDWMPMARRLGRKYRFVALDLPGFGESSRLGHNRHDVVSQVRRFRAFAQKVGLGSFHLVGCGVGGAVAGVFASLFPKDVNSLTMIEPFGIDAPTKGDVERLSGRGWSPLTAGTEQDYERVLKLLYRDPPKATGFLQRRRRAAAIENQVFEEQVWKQLWESRPYVLEQVLSEIKVRTLLLWGDSQKVAHQSALKVLSQGIPTATPVTIKGCGHLMMLEKPKEVGDRVGKFIRGES